MHVGDKGRRTFLSVLDLDLLGLPLSGHGRIDSGGFGFFKRPAVQIHKNVQLCYYMKKLKRDCGRNNASSIPTPTRDLTQQDEVRSRVQQRLEI